MRRSGVTGSIFAVPCADRAAGPPAIVYDATMPDPLTLFGLFAVSAMLVFYAFEARGPWYTFGFAAGCALGSTYGFLQGAWPFGLVEGIWTLVAFRKGWRRLAGRLGGPRQGRGPPQTGRVR